MRSLILIIISYIISYKFLVKNLLKDLKILKINEIPNSNYNSLYSFHYIKSNPKIGILMRTNLGRVWISGVLITICIGLFSICIQRSLDFGSSFLLLGGKKGLPLYTHYIPYTKQRPTKQTPRESNGPVPRAHRKARGLVGLLESRSSAEPEGARHLHLNRRCRPSRSSFVNRRSSAEEFGVPWGH